MRMLLTEWIKPHLLAEGMLWGRPGGAVWPPCFTYVHIYTMLFILVQYIYIYIYICIYGHIFSLSPSLYIFLCFIMFYTWRMPDSMLLASSLLGDSASSLATCWEWPRPIGPRRRFFTTLARLGHCRCIWSWWNHESIMRMIQLIRIPIQGFQSG